MTIATFPVLAGQAWPVTRTTLWSTAKEEAINGTTSAFSNWSFPRYKFALSYNYLGSGNVNGTTNTDWQTLAGFYDQMQGSTGVFQYNFTEDSAVVAQSFGTGDATTTAFQLSRTLGNSLSPVYAPRINLISSDFCYSITWGLGNASIAATNIADPSGGSAGISLIENTANSTHYITTNSTMNANEDYTTSVYAHANTRGWLLMTQSNKVPTTRGRWFDLTNGVLGQEFSSVNTTKSCSITNIGGGWYRCTMVIPSGSGASSPSTNFYISNANGTQSYTGTSSGIYLFGPQVEQGAIQGSGATASAYPLGPYIYINDWRPLPLALNVARSNVALRSQDFTHATWVATHAAVNSTQPAPDGTTTAQILNDDNTTNRHYITQTVSGLTAQTIYTFSVFLKANNFGWVSILLTAAANTAKVYFNVSTGAIGTVTGTAPLAYRITPCSAAGWYQASITTNTGAGTTMLIDIGTATADGVDNYLGTPTAANQLWGAQLELGSLATRYIPTTSAPVSVTDYSAISAYGVVTFASAPASTIGLTWTGSYNWYCRFDDDNVDFTYFMTHIWSNPKITFTTVKFGIVA